MKKIKKYIYLVCSDTPMGLWITDAYVTRKSAQRRVSKINNTNPPRFAMDRAFVSRVELRTRK